MDKENYIEELKTEYKRMYFWRDVCVEALATFILMSVQCSLPLSWGGGGPTYYGNVLQIAIGMGFMVCCVAWIFGDFSGCHMNPAITFGMMVAMKITFVKGLLYIAAQCCGAMAGAGFIYALTPAGRRESLAATLVHPDLENWQGALIEAWITFILVATVFASTNSRRKGIVYMPTILIGCAITVGILCACAQTGGSMNPARSLGPAVVMDIWKDHWVYWVGPMLGGALAALVYHHILDRSKIPVLE